jgi:hypothetical protein
VTFLFIVLGSIVVLLIVTRTAGRRDAVRKADLARQQAEEQATLDHHRDHGPDGSST